ncbi:MAG: ribosome biogenesis GTP-binding protein YihA/YsxC [Lactobacillus sp.]|nr:ribosome biogenesis GTP-binding protein YihA/YsxC [Lactobacillus sp.]MDN6042678.1 ribosome biogenesis GTP-binding protein YihA/YsxC [Lactobacillus sp.]MDN6052345.1 ribosome biogenesis GTP-binding protein YihA/YsxC [Lactobacillus sp.]
MIIKSSDYALSAVKDSQYPKDDYPEVALAGRSNVGKSSLINAFLKRKNLARTSGQPGKTQTLNFYLVNKSFYLVDVPGYGYAKVSQRQREQFGQMIQDYLETRANLTGLIILVDARHDPSKDDVAMCDYAQYLDLPILVVCTKMDKLKKSQASQVAQRVHSALHIRNDNVTLMTFSAVSKLHLTDLENWIEARVSR